MSHNILENILVVKREEVARSQQQVPLEQLQDRIAALPRCRNFYHAITKQPTKRVNVIAEIKKASPSAGLIREDFDVVDLARRYEAMGADAISVLTDEEFFQGRLEYLTAVKGTVELPVLRKDFIIDPYQVYQARAAGADAVLLIAEALSPGLLMDLMILANRLTMTVLLEVHDIESLLHYRSLVGFPEKHYSLLGINNRNLKTMQTDLATSLRLAEFIEEKPVLVSESGIRQRQDVERLVEAGFHGVLIGETLMRADDMETAFHDLFK